MSTRRLHQLWFAALGGLAVVAVVLLDMLLLQRWLDEPVLVVALATTVVPCVLLARSAARRMNASDRNRLQESIAGLEAIHFALLGLGIALLILFHWNFRRAASDGREYFVQVRSLVMDWDLDFANENALFGVRGTADRYAFGSALLWVPFFLLSHLWLGILNIFGADYERLGYFNAYQRGVGLGSLLYGWTGLVLAYRLACRHVDRWTAFVATVGITFGSFVLWYLVRDNSMTHAVSLFSVALFLYAWDATREDRDIRQWALLGLLAGLMTIVRWQNVLFTVVLAHDALEQIWQARRLSLRWVRRQGAMLAGFFVAVFPQLLFWRQVRGGWLAMPSGDHGVHWLNVPVLDVLFSPDRGLFSWTPLVLVAVAGLIALLRRAPRLAALFLFAFVGQIYINGTVEWSGHGFGARRFANCAPLFVVGLAVSLDWMRKRPRLAPALMIGGLVVVNMSFMASMAGNRLPPAGDIRSTEIVGSLSSIAGNPFAMPASLWTAWTHGTDLGHYERLGSHAFQNLRIDIGDAEQDERFLGPGWAGMESTADGRRFRWSDGPSSRLVFRLRGTAPRLLRVRAATYRHSQNLPQVVVVAVNGMQAGRLEPGPLFEVHELDLEASLLLEGINDIEFRYAWTESPSQSGSSRDQRQLALMFDRIEILLR